MVPNHFSKAATIDPSASRTALSSTAEPNTPSKCETGPEVNNEKKTVPAKAKAKAKAKALPKLNFIKSHEEFVDKHVLCVESIEDARSLIENLSKLSHIKHAWDTEAINIDVSKDRSVYIILFACVELLLTSLFKRSLKCSPNVAGEVICMSVSVGPGNDLGNGKCTAWIDTLGKPEILREFKEYFANSNLLKIFHNYGFDRHLLYLHDLNVLGFGGDTMHMARLLDTSRQQKGYSLAALTSDMESVMDGLEDATEILPKSSMKEMFGEKYIKKDKTEGKVR